MASAFFSLLVGAAAVLCFWIYRTYNFWKRNGVPSAGGWLPFVGHMLPVLMARKSFSEMTADVYKKYKGHSMIGIYKGTVPTLIVREPRLVKVVLQANFSSFHENGLKIEPEVDPLLAKNPFFTYGETWMSGRKRITHAFSSMRLKILFTAVSGVCKKFDEFLKKRLASADKYEVELKYLFSKFTGEVVANAGLGIEGHCFDEAEHPCAFDAVGERLFQKNTLTAISTAITFFLPQVNSLLKLRFVPKDIDAFFRRIVAENLQIRRKEETPRNDFLQLMINLEKLEQSSDDEAISSHAFSFFLDGYETSSLTLCFIGYQLAAHQDVQERLRREIKDAIARHDGEVTFEALKEMTYMDQVISESQRCYTVVGSMNKICTEEFELQGSDGITYRAKPGDEIVVPVWALHRDEKYWADPDVFDPERFSADRKHSIEQMTFLPFGEGPRICVGMRMAILQMKACLANLLNNYKLELSPKTTVPLKLSPLYFMSLPLGGCWVKISKL